MHALLVDSNETLRPSRVQALTARGWTVDECGDPDQAMEWLEEAVQLDLLITEAIFDSGILGFELRDVALEHFPNARVLFTTRYDLTGFEESVAGCRLLADPPFSTGEMIEVINEVMAGPPSLMEPTEQGEALLETGTLLGNYQILERVRADPITETYRALQTDVDRLVGLVLLRPDLAKEGKVVERFKGRARLKASLDHPRIAPLFEVGEHAGWHYYSREMPRGRSLHELSRAGEYLSERALVELLHGIAETMIYAEENGCQHRELSSKDIYLDEENQARIVNIFRADGDVEETLESNGVPDLLRILRGRAAGGRANSLLRSLSERKLSWKELRAEMATLREMMRDQSIQERIEDERHIAAYPVPKQEDSLPWWAWLALGAAGLLIAGAGAWIGGAKPDQPTRTSDLVLIPAGPFLYQQDEKHQLPDFWISRTEVTIGEYAEFLKALENAAPGGFDHPEQPKAKLGHEPPGWKELVAAANTRSTVDGHRISLDIPVSNVDWWDAYAYCRWKGLRLPTEVEWEKAARGPSGFLFPWGDEPDIKAANLGSDYDTSNGNGGSADGFRLWAPVDRQTRDISPYGVQDMAGNVQEWTGGSSLDGGWPTHPDIPDLRVPVARGGHFASSFSTTILTSRHFAESPSESSALRGFRTAADRADP